MKANDIDPSLMDEHDWKQLRDGYLRIAAECLVGHVMLSQAVHSGEVMRFDQVHTRFFDTIVPDAFTAQFVSVRCLEDWSKRYREHVVPCKFLIVELARIALRDLRAGAEKDEVVNTLVPWLRRGLVIAFIHRDEAKAIDKIARNEMPAESPSLDATAFDPLVRLNFPGAASVDVRALEWSGFVGRSKVQTGEVRIQGHRFKVHEAQGG